MLIIILTNILPHPTRPNWQSQPVKPDILGYVSEDNQLILYDPQSRTEKIVMDNVENFLLSSDGQIAYTSSLDGSEAGFYIIDPANPEDKFVTIDQPMAYPLSWSPDGHYLAYLVFNADIDENDLYVWDGETVVNITPKNLLDSPSYYDLHWSQDNRLAFGITHGWSGADAPSELYVWNGHTTRNLRPNPENSDSLVEWSEDGKLIFLAWKDEDTEFDVYIWNGKLFDESAFTPILSEFRIVDATWLDNHRIAFISINKSESNVTKTVMIWDMEKDEIVEWFPVKSELTYSRFSPDRRFVVSTHLASGIPSIYLEVEDSNGNILLSTHVGELSWSRNGYLAYCGINERISELLTVWNGTETSLVKRLSYRPIQWQATERTFSCNNG